MEDAIDKILIEQFDNAEKSIKFITHKILKKHSNKLPHDYFVSLEIKVKNWNQVTQHERLTYFHSIDKNLEVLFKPSEKNIMYQLNKIFYFRFIMFDAIKLSQYKRAIIAYGWLQNFLGQISQGIWERNDHFRAADLARAKHEKQKMKEAPTRTSALNLWKSLNPKTGKGWRSYTECANYFCIQQQDESLSPRTVASWISTYEKHKPKNPL
ncbi:hypothetical protein [Alkanindiges illinoisensis]|uniref:hypothetical protein n=1 Tax=Alkanindiges illinoisensis TaxID=197183 RepID=UPI00047C2BC3|nr:hypothetical protein [Alkanindiges illinoisensis]